VTVVRSGIEIPQALGVGSRQFIGQSPLLINGYVSYSAGTAATVSVLYNYFGDRLFRYANATTGNGGSPQANPSLIERARGALDAKASFHLTPHLRWSIGARNLTRETVLIIEDAGLARPFERYNPGRTFSTSFSYDF
jgi:outer membrane receptor protein involved in Fe transport